MQFARANVTVVGLEVDAEKVDLINRGQSYIKHIKQESVEEALKEERLCDRPIFSAGSRT